MKSEELEKLKEKVLQLKQERDKVLSIQAEIKKLEETEEVKKYLELLNLYEEKTIKKYLGLLNLYEEKTTGIHTGIETYTDEKIIDIALGNTTITPEEDIYVYIGTYKYTDEVDIVHGSRDISVNRNDHDADYVVYQNLESHYWETVEILYKKADEFESTHKVIFPQNVVSRQRYFYDLQREYFETMVFESPEKAKEKVYKLIRK